MHLPARTCPFGPDDFLQHVGTPFEPAPELAEKLLGMMHSAKYGLFEIAATAKISIEQLTIWMMRPSIAARLDAMESVFARRCRLQLANNTSAIIHCCESVIGYYHFAQDHMYVAQSERLGHILQVKQGSNALLACRLLLHLAKHFSPRPPKQLKSAIAGERGPSEAPSPATGGGGPVDAQHQPGGGVSVITNTSKPHPALPANSLLDSSPFDLLGQLASVTLNFGDHQGAITRDAVARDDGPNIPSVQLETSSPAQTTERTLEASSPAGGAGGRGPVDAQHQPGEGERAATTTSPAPSHNPTQSPSSAARDPGGGGPSPTTIPRGQPACDAEVDQATEAPSPATGGGGPLDRISDQAGGGVRAVVANPTPASTLLSLSGSPKSRDRP